MKDKSINLLITGAAGFLGGRAAKYFGQHKAFKVLATSRRNHRKEELEAANCQFVAGNLEDPQFCNLITQDMDMVVHCAALSAPFGSYQNFYDANVLATQQLVDACLHNGVKKFIYISTPSIYFNHQDRFDVKETDPLPAKMVNAYAQTKLIAEQYVLQKNTQGLQTLALRPRAIIGAEDTVIFPRVLEAYHQGRLKIIGDGKNKVDMTSVSNLLVAIHCAIQAKENAYGEAYNITDGNSVPFWETVNYALSSLGYAPVTQKIPKYVAMNAAALMEWKAKLIPSEKEPALTRYGIGILCHHFTLNIEKAKNLLGYQPVCNTLDGMNEFITWKQNKPLV